MVLVYTFSLCVIILLNFKCESVCGSYIDLIFDIFIFLSCININFYHYYYFIYLFFFLQVVAGLSRLQGPNGFIDPKGVIIISTEALMELPGHVYRQRILYYIRESLNLKAL
jgi:hypothetical protein